MDRIAKQSPLWTSGVVIVALLALAVAFDRPGTAKSMLGAGALAATLILLLAEAGIKSIRQAARLADFFAGITLVSVGVGTAVFALRHVFTTGRYEVVLAMVFWSALYMVFFRKQILEMIK
ncbi:MAG TPA: hypothetical protein VGB55_02255 [Tepidisphaeraceae bacterium]|jgi:hypothetical protein